MVGFEDFRNLSEAELYNALTSLANVQTNSFGITESGQRLYDLAIGLKDKILSKEDIVGSEEKDGLLNDFAEEIKDDGIDPEVINKTLRDVYGVGKKYVTEPDQFGVLKGKYVDDSEPHSWEGYIRKPKEEIKPEIIKEDFTEKVLMVKLKDKLNDLEKKYPGLLGIDKKIDDAIELKKEIEQEIKEISDKEGVKDGGDNTDDVNKSFTDDFVEDLLVDLSEEFTIDPKIRDNLAVKLSKVLHKKLYGE